MNHNRIKELAENTLSNSEMAVGGLAKIHAENVLKLLPIVEAAAWVNELQEIKSWIKGRFQVGTMIESENLNAFYDINELLWEARYTCLWGALQDAGITTYTTEGDQD